MAQVRYGKEGQAYPVEAGQLWRCAGATFRCGDISSYKPPPPNLLYCDPPWNNAMVKQFRHKAGLVVDERDYLAIYRAVIGCVPPGVPVFVEAGTKEAAEIYGLLPGPGRAMIRIKYYGIRPAILLYGGRASLTADFVHSITDMDDQDVPHAVMAAYGLQWPRERLLVVDPCAGRGLTARAAWNAQWESHNNELNPLRVSAALARMVRLTGEEAVRIA